MSGAPLLSDLREPPKVGHFYLVPAIDYTWMGKRAMWPVLGPLHDDREFFNFRHLHYHLDLRFLTAPQWKLAQRNGYRRLGVNAFASDAELAAGSQPLCRMDDPLPKGRPTLIRRRCRLSERVYAYPNADPVKLLNAKYAEADGLARPIQRADGRLLCPHRKVDLSTYKPDAAGVVVCPLHGLRVKCAEAA